MTIFINILLFIFILGIIVAIHEFGHFIFAKIMGVYVYEYAIGMGNYLVLNLKKVKLFILLEQYH